MQNQASNMSAEQSFESLPNGTILTEGDGSMSRNLKSRQKELQLQKKLDKISEQLAEVRAKRLTMKRFDDGRVRGPPRDYTSVPKKLFSHPRLEYVYGEIMHSPYMTNPKDSYPKTTYTMVETLKGFKQKGVAFKDIPETEKPYDDIELKRQFIKEVCNYNPKFNIPKMIKKNGSGEGSVTSAGTSKRAGTASSTNGRSTANSTVASSTTSLKDERTGGSLRKRQLNVVKPRKHASATSMSLDASGFVSSATTGGDSKKDETNTSLTSAASTKSMADALEAAAEAKDASNSANAKAADDDYNDDFEQPVENTSSAEAKDSYEEEVFESHEEVAAEAEEAPAEEVVSAVNSGSEKQPASTPFEEPVEEEDVYDADFENTGTLPASLSTAPPTTTNNVDGASPLPVEDAYENDFEVPSVPVAAAVPVSAQAPAESSKGEEAAYGDDFEVTDNREAANESPTTATAAELGSSTKTDTDKFLDSIKLRTDLVAAPQKEGTARSLLSEGVTTDIRDEHATVRTAETPVPSTVRSELDAHITPGPFESAPHSHTNSFLSSDLENESDERRSAKPEAEPEAEAQASLQISEKPESSRLLDTSEVPAVADDPIDEILYMESKVDGGKTGETISNNYLNSPQRGGVVNSFFEDASGSPANSPGQQSNLPDEEIGEEIE